MVLVDRRSRWTREEVRILVYLVLGIATLFTWYAGWSNTIAGTFLEVFHEGTGKDFVWQTARSALMADNVLVRWLNVNVFFALIYALAGVGCYGLTRIHCPRASLPAARWMAAAAAAFFVGTLGLATLGSAPTLTYRMEWRRIRERLAGRTPSGAQLSETPAEPSAR